MDKIEGFLFSVFSVQKRIFLGVIMETYRPLDFSWGIIVNISLKYLFPFLGNPKLAKLDPFASMLSKQEVTGMDEVDDEIWWSSPELAKLDSVYAEVLEKSKLFLSNESLKLDLSESDKDIFSSFQIES